MQGRQAEPGGAKAPGGERFNDVNQQVVTPSYRSRWRCKQEIITTCHLHSWYALGAWLTSNGVNVLP